MPVFRHSAHRRLRVVALWIQVLRPDKLEAFGEVLPSQARSLHRLPGCSNQLVLVVIRLHDAAQNIFPNERGGTKARSPCKRGTGSNLGGCVFTELSADARGNLFNFGNRNVYASIPPQCTN